MLTFIFLLNIANLFYVRLSTSLFLWVLGNLRERDHWGDPDVDGRMILEWIFRKWEGVS